jgi:hypothetical protein
MYVMTTWKLRPISPEQTRRMMDVWAKSEAKESESSADDRVCWFISADGSCGVTVTKVSDADAAIALGLETSLALSEFLELDTRIVLDLDTAMPSISQSMEYLPA